MNADAGAINPAALAVFVFFFALVTLMGPVGCSSAAEPTRRSVRAQGPAGHRTRPRHVPGSWMEQSGWGGAAGERFVRR